MSQNWLRSCYLSFSGKSGKIIQGGGPTDLRIVFSIKQWGFQSPNMASFRIYNVSPQTRAQFQNKEFTKVEFYAGYQGNVGLIFSGDIKQSIFGHETAIDTYLDVFAGDSQQGYQAARVTKTLAAGWTPKDKVQIALDALAPFGISLGPVNVDLSQPVYPRGRAFIGMARDLLRQVSLSAGAMWSMQMGRVYIVDQRKPIAADTVTLAADTGLVGWPQQTHDGIKVRSLLNPKLQPHVNIRLDPSKIIEAAKNNNTFTGGPADPANIFLDSQALSAGVYNILAIDRFGDSRGQDWYDESTCIGKGGIPGPGAAQAGYSVGTL